MKIFILFVILMNSTFAANRKGHTWGLLPSELPELVNVDCSGKPDSPNGGERAPNCNPYEGDTYCQEARPILCINKSKVLPQPKGVRSHQWSGAEVQITSPMKGIRLKNLAEANTICSKKFGSTWRMAEFHDAPAGWGLWAKGKVAKEARFWVYINDQKGNCWD